MIGVIVFSPDGKLAPLPYQELSAELQIRKVGGKTKAPFKKHGERQWGRKLDRNPLSHHAEEFDLASTLKIGIRRQLQGNADIQSQSPVARLHGNAYAPAYLGIE